MNHLAAAISNRLSLDDFFFLLIFVPLPPPSKLPLSMRKTSGRPTRTSHKHLNIYIIHIPDPKVHFMVCIVFHDAENCLNDIIKISINIYL